MYVCVCNQVTDGQIRPCRRGGVTSMESLQASRKSPPAVALPRLRQPGVVMPWNAMAGGLPLRPPDPTMKTSIPCPGGAAWPRCLDRVIQPTWQTLCRCTQTRARKRQIDTRCRAGGR